MGIQKYLGLCLLLVSGMQTLSAKYPTHSIMPYLAVANTGVSDYTLRVSHGLQVKYSSGDKLRSPMGIRYQYRMKKGHVLGADFFSIYNPLQITPEYLDANSSFGGPSISSEQRMNGFDLHYSKTIDIKLLEVFGWAGLGLYQNKALKDERLSDFSWYKGANADFYQFAPLVCQSSVKLYMPVMSFGAGVRFKHLEAGLNNQLSLASPINSFDYNGYHHVVPLSWKSIGYYLGYRFEF